MYDNPCNYCGNHEQCRSMLDMSMRDIPMTDMNMNMPMVNMPMGNIPMFEEGDNEDLKMLYPEIHIKIYPMVVHRCDMIVAGFGTMYCPSKIQMDHICEEICDKYEKDYRYNFDDDDDDDDDDNTRIRRRRRRPSRRNTVQDLIRVLLIGELIGRRSGISMYNYGY